MFRSASPGLWDTQDVELVTGGTTEASNGGWILADLDGDGDRDLVSPGHHVGTWVLANDGSGLFGAASAHPKVNDARSVRAGDFDEDGDVDLVIGNPWDLYVVPGDGTLTPGTPVKVGGLPGNGVWGRQPALDVDGDGHLDVLLVGPGPAMVRVAFGDGAGGFVLRQWSMGLGEEDRPSSAVHPGAVAAADLDGQAGLDLVVSGSGQDRGFLATVPSVDAAGRRFAAPEALA